MKQIFQLIASSPPIAVAAYRQVVLYVTATPAGGCSGQSALRFRPDASTPFGYTGQAYETSGGGVSGGLARVDGTDMLVHNLGGCALHYVVSGVQ